MSAERALWSLAVFFALYPPAHADDDHEHNYIVGERAVGLAGAFTAIADDSSATWYNPAGLSETSYSSFSLTAAVYGFANQEDTLLPGGRAADDSTFITYPSTAAWIQKMRDGDRQGVGRLQLAAAILSPRNNVARRRLALALPPRGGSEPRSLAQSDLLEVRLFEDEELWAGLSAAYKPLPWLSVGVSVFATLRNGLYQLYSLELIEETLDGEAFDRRLLPDRSQLSFGSAGFAAVFGAMVRLGDGLRAGLSFRTPHAALGASAKISEITLEDLGGGATGVTSNDVDLRFTPRRAWRAAIGLACVLPHDVALSFDLSMTGPLSRWALLELETEAGPVPLFRSEKRLTVQAAMGGEVYVARELPLRFGFFTNRSQLARCDPLAAECDDLANPFSDPADRYGIAGSVGYESERATLTIGASYNFGAATLQLSPGQQLRTRVEYLFFMIGGSARF